jgi:DNA-binding GntR family transcriptional regulator
MAKLTQLRDGRSLPTQLAELLRARIVAGDWGPGRQLPSEQTLADEAGVSRPTVRAALRILSATGLVRVRPGAGTFVTPRGPGVVAGLQELRSMSAIISEQRPGSEVRYRLRERRMATADEAAHFDLQTPLQVIAVERSFVSDNEVIAFESALLNAGLLPQDFDPEQIVGSIFAVLRPLGLLPDQAVATVHAVNDESVAWPEIRPITPLFLSLTQQSYNNDGQVIAWSKTYFTEGNFEFMLVRLR